MSTFYIPEDNIDRLEKKIATIRNKCSKNQIDLRYEITGEKFETYEVDDGHKVTVKYIIVEVEGKMEHNGWKFAATLAHHDAGNVIRTFNSDLIIPDKYKTCGPTCEHCNKIRSRKDTYLIYNEELKEFKQVGKTCLTEFTNGLDAEDTAYFASIFTSLEDAHKLSGSSYKTYLDVKEVLRYSFECVKHFGYEKSSYEEWEERPKHTTRQRVLDYMHILNNNTSSYTANEISELKDEIDAVKFDPNSSYAIKSANDAIKWISSIEPDNNYMNNLKIICSEPYSEMRDIGILVSLPSAYNRFLENKKYEEKKKAERIAEASSEFQGEVGDKLTINCKSFKCVTTIDSIYGTSWLYKWTDEGNNVYEWFASRPVNDEDSIKSISGTVKKHEEYRGVKQTIMTRCKVAR